MTYNNLKTVKVFSKLLVQLILLVTNSINFTQEQNEKNIFLLVQKSFNNPCDINTVTLIWEKMFLLHCKINYKYHLPQKNFGKTFFLNNNHCIIDNTMRKLLWNTVDHMTNQKRQWENVHLTWPIKQDNGKISV